MSKVWYQRPDGRWLVSTRQSKSLYLWSRIVVWDAIGRQLSADEVVHHRNGDRTDDRIENLEVLTQSEHARLHGRGAERVAILGDARAKAHASLKARATAITHCPKGHPYVGENLRQANGKRVCVICARRRTRESRERQRASVLTGDFPYIWHWRVRLGERKGQRCRVWARGAMNSIGVEFEDGFRTVTARWAVRRAA